MKTTLGGDRLGSGNKQEIAMKNYERSSHDLGYIWRSSMASGTLVPFMSELGLPGDSFDIDLACDVKTLPTVGPLFGSYKVQLDVFQCPIRLYQGKLHMNMLNIGMDMSEVLLPQVELKGKWNGSDTDDNGQISASSIFSYLNIRGIGRRTGTGVVTREFNAIPWLGYWDIYKQYYANKQEEKGVYIHAESLANGFSEASGELEQADGTIIDITGTEVSVTTDENTDLIIQLESETPGGYVNGSPKLDELTVAINNDDYDITEVFSNIELIPPATASDAYVVKAKIVKSQYRGTKDWEFTTSGTVENSEPGGQGRPRLREFDLANIDDIRMDILADVKSTTAFKIDNNTVEPFGFSLSASGGQYYPTANQEGLGIKTYQSDLFNNWISTEWIDGSNGINEVTAVDTSSGNFHIDALNLANKVYNMLNRIAISGGTYDDWLDAVYTHERARGHENPIYHGSLIKELAFEEVVSMSDVNVQGDDMPLGTLAGRGTLTGKNKGGKIKIKVDEPSYIIGLVSLTPRIDYSQGNKWDMNLKTMNDLHKPALDEIGFQDLVTDQMAWFDTSITTSGTGDPVYKSAGKQPAWINYMTNVNQTRGDFAIEGNSMFMTLNRRYERNSTGGIKDLTTYVDPSKFNAIFAQTALDSQNFWVQISNKIFARRKMSAKVIPNL